MKNNIAMSEAITIKQVAKYFGVSVRTIRQWMEKDEDFPRGFKKFGTLRFRKSEIEEYWQKNQNTKKTDEEFLPDS
jgi:excisionase family DNA binding protein